MSYTAYIADVALPDEPSKAWATLRTLSDELYTGQGMSRRMEELQARLKDSGLTVRKFGQHIAVVGTDFATADQIMPTVAEIALEMGFVFADPHTEEIRRGR